MEKLTIEMTMKAISPYQALSEQLALPQSPRQETFWASTGIESTGKLNQYPNTKPIQYNKLIFLDKLFIKAN